jgi:hypothetical protein
VGGVQKLSAGQTANEGLPPLEPPQNIQKSKKAIHPTQIERNEYALKGQLNSGREIRLYQPIELGKQNQKKTKAAPRAISEGRVLSWKGKFNNCSSGDGDDDDGSRRQANKKKFEAATAGKRAMRVMVNLARGTDWRSRIRDSRFAGRTRERLDLAIADSAGGGVQAK